MDLQRRIASRQGEFLLFALTPPRLSTSAEKAQEIADVTFERLEPLGIRVCGYPDHKVLPGYLELLGDS